MTDPRPLRVVVLRALILVAGVICVYLSIAMLAEAWRSAGEVERAVERTP